MTRTRRRLFQHLIALGTMPVVILPASAQTDYFEHRFDTIESFRQLPGGDQPATADVDGNGLEDIVFGVTVVGTSAIFVAGNRPDGSTGFKQHIALSPGDTLKNVLSSPTPAGPLVVAITAQGIVRTYRHWPLAEQFQFNVGTTVTSAALGDVDANGVVDLVVAVPQELRIYAPETGQLLRALPVSAAYTSLSLAQVDGDPALEIMAKGSPPGLFVDGATLAIDWTEPNGLRGVVGSVGQNGSSLIVATTDWAQFGTFNGIPWAATATANLPSGLVGTLAVAKLDGTNNESILVASGLSTHVYQSVPLHLLRTLSNPKGAGSIGAVDVDGDGARELAYFPHSLYPGGITLASGTDSTIRWSHTATAAPPTRTAIGDVDGDGRLELVAAGSALPSAYGLGSILVSDLESGVEEWRASSLSAAHDPLMLDAARVVLEPRSEGVGMDIVLAGAAMRGTNVQGGQLTIINGVTKQVTFSVGPSSQSTNPLDGRSVSDFAFADFDADGIKDFILATTSLYTTTIPPELHVVSGATGLTLFNSGPLPGGVQTINDVLIVEQEAGNPHIVIGLPDRVMAFRMQTGQRAWDWSIASDGVTLLRNPTFGDELAIHRTDGAVSIFSAATRQLRRSFSLPAPLAGVFALPGSSERFLAMLGEALAVVDSGNGTVAAETESLGPVAEPARPPATYRSDAQTWHIAIGSTTALHRKTLFLNERIFASGIDAAP